MSTILVQAAPGRRVLAPTGIQVPAKFLVNPADPYWARALRDEDIVTIVTETPAPAPVAAPVTTATGVEQISGDEA